MNIRLRAPEPHDLDAIYLWENDPTIRSYGAAVAPYSRAMLQEYISTYDADPLHAGQLRLIIDVDNKSVGAVDLYDVDAKNRRAFVGIVVDELCRSRGIAFAALTLLSDYCRNDLGLHQLAAVVPLSNLSSRRLFEKSDYKVVAVLPEWVRMGKEFSDAILMSKKL